MIDPLMTNENMHKHAETHAYIWCLNLCLLACSVRMPAGESILKEERPIHHSSDLSHTSNERRQRQNEKDTKQERAGGSDGEINNLSWRLFPSWQIQSNETHPGSDLELLRPIYVYPSSHTTHAARISSRAASPMETSDPVYKQSEMFKCNSSETQSWDLAVRRHGGVKLISSLVVTTWKAPKMFFYLLFRLLGNRFSRVYSHE